MANKDKSADGQRPDNQTSEQEEEELVIVEDQAADKPVQGNAADQQEDQDDDQDDDDFDDDDHDEDERRGHAEGDQEEHGDESDEDKRARRKRERRAKSIRNRVAATARERLLQQQAETIHDLTTRLNRLEGRTTRQDINFLRDKLGQIEQQQQDAKRTLAECSKAQDWDGVAEVNEIQLTLREQHRNVKIALQRATEAVRSGGNGRDEPADDEGGDGGERRTTRPQGRKPDPVVQEKARAWADQHPWVRGTDADPEEVAIVRSIDTVLAQEGISPRDDNYWKELTKRVRRRLPHHFKTASNGGRRETVDNNERGDNKPAARGPVMKPASQSSGGRRALKPNEVYISPERKKAMQDAGIWDDPVKRKKQLKAYQQWDREHAGEAQS